MVETFARAQDLIKVGNGEGDEIFWPDVKITIGLLKDGVEEKLVEYRRVPK